MTIYKSLGGVWDVDCDTCELRLSEMLTNPLPQDKRTAYRVAAAFGIREVAVIGRILHQCETCRVVNNALHQSR
jgi:hypothetical protein